MESLKQPNAAPFKKNTQHVFISSRGTSFTVAVQTHPRRKTNIQGVLRLMDITAGGDFLGLCDQKSSYKHVSDFGRLRSYDRLKLRIDGKDY